MAAEDGSSWAEALRALAAEVKRLRTPNDMSTAPRDGEFWAIVPLKHSQHMSDEMQRDCFKDREGDSWYELEDDMWFGWLPASGGEGS